MGRGWIKVSGGDHNYKVNGILGLLCRLHFPGLVQFGEELQPAYTWDHYVTALDAADRDGRVFPNKAERVGKYSSHYIAQYITFTGHS